MKKETVTMKVAIDEIRSILTRQQNPSLPIETIEYLESMLLEEVEKEDMDIETIQSTLDQFGIDPKDCETILSLMLPKSNNNQQSTTRNHDTMKEVKSDCRQSNSRSHLLPQNEESLTPSPSPPPSKYTVGNTTNAKLSPKSHRELRKERKRQQQEKKMMKKKNNKSSVSDDDTTSGDNGSASYSSNDNNDDNNPIESNNEDDNDDDDLLELNDHSSAWKETQAAGELWGGRGKGGRGVKYYGDNFHNLHLPSVSIQFQGKILLEDSPMRLDQGHRYGLLGRNGVGKSTLFRALARHMIPGLPHSYKVLLVNQQLEGSSDMTALQAVVDADVDRKSILAEQALVEADLEQGLNVQENAERFEQLLLEWDAVDGDTAEERAKDILKGLGFTRSRMNAPTITLSGGWRMRLSLAQALFVQNSIDLLLLDEVSNHLDLHGQLWLQQYLCSDKCQNLTMIVISHDRDFLGAVTTDMIVMNFQRLSYHPGNYWEYMRQMEERTAMQRNKLEAADKQRQKASEFLTKQQQQASKKSADPNKQRQAKMIKEKKLERIGMFREDGKKFKNFSLKQMDAKSMRLGQHIQLEHDERVIPMKFPNPVWPPSLLDRKSPIITLQDVSFRYNQTSVGDSVDDKKEKMTARNDDDLILRNLTLCIDRGSKIAVVGRNGCGKSTLLKLITGELLNTSEGKVTSGRIWKHANLRIGHVSQYSVEELEQYGHLTVVEYAEKFLTSGRASSRAIADASNKGYGGNNVRQYLGAFGLGGEHANRLTKTLSGGERMRLCFCTVMADEPHILVLDEASNHLDLETLDSLAAALSAFQGAVIMVSHNQGFLRIFANTLWICDDHGHVEALYSNDDATVASTTNTSSFDDLFGQYRSRVMSSGTISSRSNARKLQSDLAKRAGKQSNGGAQSRTALLP